MPRRRRLLPAAGAIVLLVLGLGAALAWRSGGSAPSGPAPAGLQPLRQPELSTLAPEVRAQIEAAYAEVTALTGSPSPDPAALAAAEGKLGALLMAYDEAGAEAPLANAAALAPQEARWPYFLGRVHELDGDFARAAADYERARALLPDYVPAQIRLAQMYRELGRDEEAAKLLEGALAADPKAAAAHEALGQIAADRGDHATAASHFEAVLALQPNASAVHSPLALAYERLGQHDKSAQHLAQLGTVRPSIDDPLQNELQPYLVGAKAWLMQADQAVDAGRPAEAVALYRKAVAADPKSARTYMKLGVVLSKQGQQDEALAAVQQAVAVDPANAEFQQVLADQLAFMGRLDEADAAYRAALARDPRNAKAQLGLAELLRKRGRCEDALPSYSAAIDALATASVGRVQRVFCQVTLGRYAEARADLAAAHADFPNDLDLTDALARILSAAPEAAVRDGPQAVELAKALVSQRQSVDAVETMAMALAAAGQYDEAVKWQQRSIELARQGGQTRWLDTLNANLAAYQQHRTATTPWPPFVLAPSAPGS